MYKFAVVTWGDAWWSDSLHTDVIMVRQTAGWLVQANKRIVRVALTIDERGPADLMNVPRAYVRDIKILDGRSLRAIAEDEEVEPTEKDILEGKKAY
jgi:hypothetical protein